MFDKTFTSNFLRKKDVDSGADPGVDSGADPGVDSGADPGVDSGADPSLVTRADSRIDSGVDPQVDQRVDLGVSLKADPWWIQGGSQDGCFRQQVFGPKGSQGPSARFCFRLDARCVASNATQKRLDVAFYHIEQPLWVPAGVQTPTQSCALYMAVAFLCREALVPGGGSGSDGAVPLLHHDAAEVQLQDP